MSASLIAALVCSVILLLIAACFLMGSVPLLILKHDTPLDARFVGGFFKLYFVATTYAALATAALALLAFGLRRVLVPLMAALVPRIQAREAGAVLAFRRLHAGLILVNLATLAVMVWSLIRLSMAMR